MRIRDSLSWEDKITVNLEEAHSTNMEIKELSGIFVEKIRETKCYPKYCKVQSVF